MNKEASLTGVKKRQQIGKANKTVFVWATLASVIVAVAAVISQFMIAQFMFNVKVLAAQNETNDTLRHNIEVYQPLKAEVAKLISNKDLTRLRATESDNALQVIVDAMPTESDQIALAASLQQAIFTRSDVKVDSLSFTNTETTTDGTAAPAASGVVEVPFSFTVSGSYDSLKKLLEDMQLSVRPISIKSFTISGSGDKLKIEALASAFYAQPSTVSLTKKKVSP